MRFRLKCPVNPWLKQRDSRSSVHTHSPLEQALAEHPGVSSETERLIVFHARHGTEATIAWLRSQANTLLESGPGGKHQTIGKWMDAVRVSLEQIEQGDAVIFPIDTLKSA